MSQPPAVHHVANHVDGGSTMRLASGRMHVCPRGRATMTSSRHSLRFPTGAPTSRASAWRAACTSTRRASCTPWRRSASSSSSVRGASARPAGCRCWRATTTAIRQTTSSGCSAAWKSAGSLPRTAAATWWCGSTSPPSATTRPNWNGSSTNTAGGTCVMPWRTIRTCFPTRWCAASRRRPRSMASSTSCSCTPGGRGFRSTS